MTNLESVEISDLFIMPNGRGAKISVKSCENWVKWGSLSRERGRITYHIFPGKNRLEYGNTAPLQDIGSNCPAHLTGDL